MNKAFVFIALSCIMYKQVDAQTTDPFKPQDVNKLYVNAEKLMLEGNFSNSLELLKKDSSYLNVSDSLLYLKIKILENLFPVSAVHTRDLDSSLRLFLQKVNKYSFPEQKYAEVGRINSQFSLFKERDKNFYDSIIAVANLERLEALAKIKMRIDNYLESTPNSFYIQELNATSKTISHEIARVEKIRRKTISDSTNRVTLKRFGKGSVINVSYSVATGNGKMPFSGLNTYSDVDDFFSGLYMKGLGIKYTLGASLFNTMFNIYTSPKVKASIDWNIFDAEYTVFDWSNDTLLKKDLDTYGAKSKELKSIKAGTRIGPTATVLLTRKIAVSIYYSARPGVQFIMGSHYFKTLKNNAKEEYKINPEIINYNLSNEVGIKFRFFKTLYINPYIHFGKFNWENSITNLGSSNDAKTVNANYSYTLLGMRLGL